MARTKRLNPTTAVRGLASHAMVLPLTDSSVDALTSLRRTLDGARPPRGRQWTSSETETLLHTLSIGLHVAHPAIEGVGEAIAHGAPWASQAARLGSEVEFVGGLALPISTFAETFIGLSEMGQAHREGQARDTTRSLLGAYSAAYADEIARIAVGRLEGGSEPVPLWDTSRLTTGGLQIWQVLGWYDAHSVLAALGDKATVVLDTLVDAYSTREGIETALRGVVIDTCLQTAEPEIVRAIKGTVETPPDRSATPADFDSLTEALGLTPAQPSTAQPTSPVLPAQGGPSSAPPGDSSWWTDETRSTPADDGLTSPITSEPREGRSRPGPMPIDDGLTTPLEDTRSSERREPPPDDQLTSDIGTSEQPGDESRWYWPEETPTGGSGQAVETYVEPAGEESMGVGETALDQETGYPISTAEGVTWSPPPQSMSPPTAGTTEPYIPQPLPQSVNPTYEPAETTYQTSASQDFTESTRPDDYYQQSRPDESTFGQPGFEQPTTEAAFVQEVAPEELFEQDDEMGEEMGEEIPQQFMNEPPG